MYTYIHTLKPPSSLSLCMCSEPSLRCQPNDSTSREGLAIHLLHCPSDRDEVWPGGITTKKHQNCREWSPNYLLEICGNFAKDATKSVESC